MRATKIMFEVPISNPCGFCADLAGTRECVLVAEGPLAAAMVNERQYERGAMLVVPRAHRETVLDITGEEIAAVYELVRIVARAAASAFDAVGMSVFQNNGMKAGQSEAHFHVHVVPRYGTSDPGRNFRQRDFERISMREQRAAAEEIRSYVQPISARAEV